MSQQDLLNKIFDVPEEPAKPLTRKEQVCEAAKLFMTNEDIALLVNVSLEKLLKTYGKDIARSQAEGRRELLKAMFESASMGSVSSQIWLSKQLLSMREPKQMIESTIETKVDIKEIEERINSILSFSD